MKLRKFVRETLREYVEQLNEIDWLTDFSDVQHTCMDAKDVADYLNRVRANAPKSTEEREKFKKSLPFIHAKSSFFKKESGYDVVDVEDFIKEITTPPSSIIGDTNEKIKHTGGFNEFVYKTGIPAFRGIVYDKKDKKFHYVNTCPGAGSCVLICYALKGNYIRYANSYDLMTRRLNYLMNHPDKYEKQLYDELEKKAKEHNAYEGYKSKVIIRWNDSGDFFSKKYVDIAEKVLKKLKEKGYNVESYAYTKIADVTGQSDIDTIFSLGADIRQLKKVDMSKQKNAKIIPSELSKGLNPMKVKDEEEYIKRVIEHFDLEPDYVITYSEMMQTPKGSSPKWHVIVSPGDGDDAAFRKDVKTILLTQH